MSEPPVHPVMDLPQRPFELRSPCRACEGAVGYLSPRGGQDCVYCANCKRFQYNAPRVETGRKPRTTVAVHELIRPAQRVRILMRASGRCELCGVGPSAENPLHVGHVLAVKEGLELGLTEQELNDDFNLVGLCAACNLGMASESFSPRMILALYRSFLAARKRGAIDNGAAVPAVTSKGARRVG